PMAGVNAVWSDTDKNFILTPESETYSTTLHIVKNNISFQTGAGEGEEISLDIGDMSARALGLDSVNVTSHERASKSITILDRAIRQLSSQRSKIGAYQNALEHTIENLTVTNTNLTAAESRIRDADMSKSMLELVKFQIINQTSTSMLAQANQTPQSVLNLLQ
ncbi:MAG: flagellin, partial [Synergistaceae bacterium]|nr:flagellin [Synergistaceae bacterium]